MKRELPKSKFQAPNNQSNGMKREKRADGFCLSHDFFGLFGTWILELGIFQP
jgi:hypothetical protein